MTPAIGAAAAGVFVFVAVLVGLAVSTLATRAAPEQRRIRALVSGPGGTVLVQNAGGLTESFDPMLARLSGLLPKSAKEMSRLQRRLARAGYPRANAAIYFSLARLVCPLALGAIAIAIVGISGWMYIAGAAAIGFVIPGMWVDRKMKLRKKAIRNGLPDALDLITVCVEAGSGLDQAIAKAAEELNIAHPALAEELQTIITEMRAGKPRNEAFKNFASRTGVDDVRSLVTMLTQTDRFGTSIGEALRTHADTLRTKRRQEAEERAAKVAVKLVFPLALCLFPALYIVCFGPVALKIYRAFY